MESRKVNTYIVGPSISRESSTTSESTNNTFGIDSKPEVQNMISNQDNKTASKWTRLEFILNIINHILIGFITIYLSWMCLRLNLKKTALHAWLCTLGYVLLMAEGAMSHYNGNVVLFIYTRKTKTTVHWILQALGGFLGIVGGIVKIAEKEIHFITTHGKLGIASMVICGVSMVSGLSALYSQTLKRYLQPLLNKTVHIFLGISALVLGLLAQYYGYKTGFFRRQVEEDFRVMMEVITLVVLILSCIGPLKALRDKCWSIYENL